MSAMGAMFTVGSIMVFSIAPYVSYRVSVYIPLAINVFHLIVLFTIPESPIFYAIQGKRKEMIAVLEDLGRPNDAEKIVSEADDLTETNTSTIKDWKELFMVRSNRKALFIVVIINVLQHGSGVMAVLFFSAAIFDMAGSNIDSNVAMIIIGCCQLMGSAVTPLFIESTGRKNILIISSSVCTISMFTLGLYFYLLFKGFPVVYTVNWLPLVVLILFFIGYDFGLGIIPNTLMGEMFTSNVRSKGSTLTLTTSWLFGFLVSTAFGAFFVTIGGHVAFWFFSGTCACALLFTIFVVPETKGKTLLEIQQSL
ncbi:facilitated trehalose transporter Tret1-like [Bicyclus anynana]|uniref:Facilitated trehalose transporter Tret1-like n=1 Tax=Bicyclus anynana TaxID=110368 RepID=A0A6J1NIT4_BICAN|nr:facilitated trehalose transporter Tret1-like [Bicyclus anynana]